MFQGWTSWTLKSNQKHPKLKSTKNIIIWYHCIMSCNLPQIHLLLHSPWLCSGKGKDWEAMSKHALVFNLLRLVCDVNNYFLVHLHVKRNVQTRICMRCYLFPNLTFSQKVPHICRNGRHFSSNLECDKRHTHTHSWLEPRVNMLEALLMLKM